MKNLTHDETKQTFISTEAACIQQCSDNFFPLAFIHLVPEKTTFNDLSKNYSHNHTPLICSCGKTFGRYEMIDTSFCQLKSTSQCCLQSCSNKSQCQNTISKAVFDTVSIDQIRKQRHLGCFIEKKNSSFLERWEDAPMNLTRCIQHCFLRGYLYAAISKPKINSKSSCSCLSSIDNCLLNSNCEDECLDKLSDDCNYITREVYFTSWKYFHDPVSRPVIQDDNGEFIKITWNSSLNNNYTYLVQEYTTIENYLKKKSTIWWTLTSTKNNYFHWFYKSQDHPIGINSNQKKLLRIVTQIGPKLYRIGPSVTFQTCEVAVFHSVMPHLSITSNAVATFQWSVIKNLKINYTIELLEMDSLSKSLKSGLNINQMQWNLQPLTRYSVTVYAEGTNCIVKGRPLIFNTNCSVPDPPKITKIDKLISPEQNSTSLKVFWEPPHTINCRRILKVFYQIRSVNGLYHKEEMIDEPNDQVNEIFIQNLLPCHKYTFSMAIQNDGHFLSSSTENVTLTTSEIAFDAPKNVRLIFRTKTSLQIQWDAPKISKCKVIKYKIVLSAVTSYTVQNVQQMQTVLLPLYQTKYMFINLLTATQYKIFLCEILNHTLGPPVEMTVWTEIGEVPTPQVPEIDVKKSTDSTLTISLSSPNYLPAGPLSGFRIVVNLNSVNSLKINETTLWDANSAWKAGLSYYITAEFLPHELEETFVVGDGKIYGSLYNAPLQKGNKYEIYFGIMSSLDNVFKISYSAPLIVTTAEENISSYKSLEAPTKDKFFVYILIIAITVLLLISVIIVTFFYQCYQKPQRYSLIPSIIKMKQLEDCVALTQNV